MRKLLCVGLVMFLGSSELAFGARYGTLDLQLQSTGSSVNTSLGSGPVGGYVFAVSDWQADNPMNNGVITDGNRTLFCIDFTTHIGGALYNDAVVRDLTDSPPLNSLKGTQVRKLYTLWSSGFSTGSLSSAATQAALSLAIWEVVEEAAGSVKTVFADSLAPPHTGQGAFYVTSSGSFWDPVKSLADIWLKKILTDPSVALANAYAIDPVDNKDQEGNIQPQSILLGGALRTPAPAALVQLMGLGMMIGLVGVWRRRRTG